MPDTSSPQADELRSKAKLVRIGCAINVLLFAALAVVMVVFLIATARTLDFTPATSEGAADEAAIRRVIDDQAAAWNKGDLDGFMAGYWKDEKLTFTSGDTVTQGWDATRERYVKRYKSEGKEMGKLAFEELQVESLSPTVALVRGHYKLTLRDGSTPTGRFTLTFRKFSDGWKITSDHTSAKEQEKN